MRNPAAELLELFMNWSEPLASGGPFTSRKFNSNESQALDEHLLAMSLLAAMKTSVDDLERGGYRVASFRRGFRLWTKVVLNYPHAWTQATNAAVFTEHALDTLEALAGAIDAHVPMPTPDKVADILSYLDGVTSLLGDDRQLSEELRVHVARLVGTIRQCISEESVFGETDLRQSLYDLWIALYAAAGQSDGEAQNRWKSMAERIFQPAAAGFLASIPAVAVSVAQLTQGS